MKVIHTHWGEGELDKTILYPQILSALLARRHYDNISFYGNESTVDRISSLSIDLYDNFTVLPEIEFDVRVFSIPKIYTYLLQEEEFLHIDNDTLLFSPPNINKISSSIAYSHPDVSMETSGDFKFYEGINELLRQKPGVELRESYISHVNQYNEIYLNLFGQIDHPKFLHENIDVTSIPNMNMVYCNDNRAMKLACQETLNHFNKNRDIIFRNDSGACYIEQLILDLYLKHIITTPPQFLNKADAFSPGHNFTHNPSDIQYPFNVRVIKTCSSCSHQEDDQLEVWNENELFDVMKNGGADYIHLGHSKHNPLYIASIINMLLIEIGEENLIKIHKNLNQGISEGELIYEKVSGSKIFSSI